MVGEGGLVHHWLALLCVLADKALHFWRVFEFFHHFVFETAFFFKVVAIGSIVIT